MRAVIQRVSQASVTIEGAVKGAIENGLLVLLAIVPENGVADWALRGVSLAAGLAIAVAYVWKTRAAYMADRDLYRRMEGKELWYPPFRLP